MTENNTLSEFSDGEDDWIFDINENNVVDDSDLLEWSDSEADDIICNMIVDDSQWSNPEPDDIVVDDSQRSNDESDDSEWGDPEADDIIRNMIVDDSEWSNPELDSMDVDELTNPGTDDVIHIVQTGRGKKRKSDEPLLPEKDFYEIESVKNH